MKRIFFLTLLLLAGSAAAFTLDAQTLSFPASELLGRPTANSVTVNVEASRAIEAYFEYGLVPGVYTNQTAKVSAAAYQLIDFLMAAFPVADLGTEAPSPIVFPQVVDGGGYRTEFTFISPVAASSATLDIRGETGSPLRIGE
jgi:hypothetical protein